MPKNTKHKNNTKEQDDRLWELEESLLDEEEGAPKTNEVKSTWSQRWIHPNVTGFLVNSAIGMYTSYIPGLMNSFRNVPVTVSDIMGASGSSMLVRMYRMPDDKQEIPTALKVVIHLGVAAAVGCGYRAVLESIGQSPEEAQYDIRIAASTVAVQTVVTANAQKLVEVGAEYLAKRWLFCVKKNPQPEEKSAVQIQSMSRRVSLTPDELL